MATARINGGPPNIARLVARLGRVRDSITRAEGDRLASLKAEEDRLLASIVEQRAAIDAALAVLATVDASSGAEPAA